MNRDFKYWGVRYRLVDDPTERYTDHLGHLTKEEVVKFFGIDGRDVEWYDIKEIRL